MVASVPHPSAVPLADVDPRLARLAGDVAKPRGAVPIAKADLAHVPGRQPGRLQAILTLTEYMRRGADFIADYADRYGPISLFPFRDGLSVLVTDPILASRIARNADRSWSAALAWTSFFEGFDLSDSLLALDFEPHKEARKWLQPAFTPAALADYLAIATPLIERAVDRWTARGKVAFKPEVRSLLASVSSRIFVGEDDSGPLLDRALADTWLGPYAIFRNRFFSARWRRGQLGYALMRDTLTAKIPERIAVGGKDLFSRMCAEMDASHVEAGAMVRLFMNVMLGAFDTTSAGLTSMAYLLAKHPAWQDRLRQEALAVGDGPLTPQGAEEMKATDRAWKETLRLLPVTGGIPRRALRDTELGGLAIPAGTMVFAMIGPAQRDGDWWTSPRQFDPDRFSPERAEDKRRPGLFMPFGAGAHACIGSQLATLEAKAFWATMLSRCRFRLARDYTARHTYTPMGMVSGDVDLVVERV
jgi:cytochrome P450